MRRLMLASKLNLFTKVCKIGLCKPSPNINFYHLIINKRGQGVTEDNDRICYVQLWALICGFPEHEADTYTVGRCSAVTE
jgi:hypothetical protein